MRSFRSATPSVAAFLVACASSIGPQAADLFQPDPAALTRVAAQLPSEPTAFGPALIHREEWDRIASRPEMQQHVRHAEEEMRTPLPELPDALFLDYSKTGNRRRCETVLFARRARASSLALAECIENRGRFLEPLETTLQSITRERTWVMPAHDGRLDNFHGRQVTIDLAVAMFAWELATIDRVLAAKLSPSLRTTMGQELERRVFAPFRRMTAGEQDQYWLLHVHNWNAVCLAGVTGAALTSLDDPKERAWFVLAAEKYSANFLKGFTPDGYCSEGVGYWNYGFGNYAALAEAVRRATGGGIDLLARPEAIRPALYGLQIDIADGICPAFADCDVDARPGSRLVGLLRRRFGLTDEPAAYAPPTRGSFQAALMDLFPSPAPPIPLSEPIPTASAPRTWFPDAGVLICRPGSNAGTRLAVAIKGGHNAEHHNHNDVGTFIAVVGGVAVLPDIGSEVYTQRTFSGRRYESQALNSFGHPVPLIAGKMQSPGRQAAARLLALDRSDERADTVAFDLTAAYDVPSLSKLTRTCIYNRTGYGSLTVVDEFAFSQAETFETALMTFGRCEQPSPRVLLITDGAEAVRVDISAPDNIPVEVRTEAIGEDLTARRTATRIGLRLKEAVRDGKVTVVITPSSASAHASPDKLSALPGPASPALEAAAKALADGQGQKAREGFDAIVRDASAPPFVRGLAWCGLAELAVAGELAGDIGSFRKRLAADAAVPTLYRDAALRRLTEVDRSRRDEGDSAGEIVSGRVQLPDVSGATALFHIAPKGNDSNDGTEEAPFLTLPRARDAVRALKQSRGGRLPSGGVAVVVHGGMYAVSETFGLNAEDSGEPDAPTVYRAKEGETPVFSGGVRIANWTPLEDPQVRERLAASTRDRVLAADLGALGVTDYGDPTDLGRRPDLFVDGVPQTLARWPNEGFVKTGELLGQDTFEVWNSIAGCRDGRFRYVEDRPSGWVGEPDVRLYGYWFWDWYEEFQQVERIDPSRRSYTLARPYSQYGYRSGQRYYALNVLSELDQPGEWYLDRQGGRAFWLPPENLDAAKAEVVLSVLDRPFIALDNANHVIVLGLSVQEGRANGIQIRGGTNCLVAGCTIRRLGGEGVVIEGGHHNGLFGCRLDTLGCGGARLAGGDRQTLAAGRHFVENCTVSDISRLKRTYTPAVHLDGCGQRVAHNLFERMPSSAMRIEGNDHLVELNVIRDVVQESDDQGGIDMFGNPLYRGTVIRWNRWSDIRGGTHNGAAGVRLDDMISGTVVQGNVFERCGAVAFGGVQIHGGKDNWVDGNVFIDCFAGISFSRWGEKRWLDAIAKVIPQAANPAHVARYPELARLETAPDVNVVTRNLFARCGQVFLRDGNTQQTILNARSDKPLAIEAVSSAGATAREPALRTLLFEPIPLSRMGPYEHPWRAEHSASSAVR